MYRLVSTFLIGLIVACPLLCQAAQVDWCADGCEATCLPSEAPESPAPCPDDGVACICAGAVHSPDLRAADLAPDLLPTVDGWLLAAVVQPIPLALSGDGMQPNWAPWGAPQRVHALTQRFRC